MRGRRMLRRNSLRMPQGRSARHIHGLNRIAGPRQLQRYKRAAALRPRSHRARWERCRPSTARTLSGANCSWRYYGRRNQSNPSDFGRYTETIRRTPVARAAADVYPKVFHSMQPAGEGLKETDEQIPWPKLSAVRVTGDLN